MSSDKKSNNESRPNGFNQARHEQKKPKLNWIQVSKIAHVIKSK